MKSNEGLNIKLFLGGIFFIIKIHKTIMLMCVYAACAPVCRMWFEVFFLLNFFSPEMKKSDPVFILIILGDSASMLTQRALFYVLMIL